MALSLQCTEACVRLVFEAVNENSIYKLLIAKQTYNKIELLTSLAQCNEEGETPLVVAMKGKDFVLIYHLVKVLKECDNQIYKYHLMFLLDQLSHQIPVLELIENLMDDSYNSDVDWLEFIAQVFIKSTSLTRHDKIIALELIGACLIIKYPYFKFYALFFECWREAMTLRFCPPDGEPLLPKIPEMCVPSVASSEVYGSNVEVMSMEEFELLMEDFVRDLYILDDDVHLLCIKRMKIQALLVIRRICSQANYGHPHWLYLNSLNWFGIHLIVYIKGFNLDSSVNSKIMIKTQLLILEQISELDPKVLSHQSYHLLKSSLWNLLTCLKIILETPLDSPEREELSYANLLAPTRFITAMKCDHPNALEYFSNLAYGFLVLLESISPQMTIQENQMLEEYYSNYIQNFIPSYAFTVLHAAVLYENISYSSYTKNTNIIKLILKLGADPNATDDCGQTPLHILASIEEVPVNECVPIFQTLVDAGGHLDMIDDGGETVLSHLKKTLMLSHNRSIPVHPYFKSLFNTVFPLSCYCARVIRQHGLRFDEDRLPLLLLKLVARHGA